MILLLDKFLIRIKGFLAGIIAKWTKKVDMEHSDSFTNDINAYAARLNAVNLPCIYSLPHLCLLSRINIQDIINVSDSERTDHYSRFKLRKKSGGFRIISIPSPQLKYLQRWILYNILNKIRSHIACKGFDPETSIKLNAQVHLNSESLLRIDLLRFYDSINEKRVFGVFKNMGYHSNLAVSMAKLVTVKPDRKMFASFKKNELALKQKILAQPMEGILPQGAPTSPKIANLISRNLDKRLSAFAEKNGLKYTRYADDLVFSGSETILAGAKKAIYRIIKEENFFINYGKTKLVKRGGKFLVTGLNVQSTTVKVPKIMKKDIEHHLFNCLKNGAHIHMMKSKIKKRNFKDWLLGNICFVYSIEPETGERYFKYFNKIVWPI